MKKALAMTVLLAPLTLSCQAQSEHSLFAPAPGSPFAVGRQPNDIVAADVNGDGHLDLLTANIASNNISVLLGDGRGRFRPAPPVLAGAAPHLLAAGDLNGDGHLDLALTSHDSNGVIILLGDGQGGFDPAPGSPVPALEKTPAHNHGLALADVDEDGRLDLITTNQNDESVSVLLNQGQAGFRPAPGSPFPTGRMPYMTGAGDVNADGHLDLATANARDASVTLLLGDGAGRFSPAPSSPVAVHPRPYFVSLADLNGDDQLDLIATHSEDSRVSVLLGEGQGSFRPAPGVLRTEHRGWKILVRDFDRDGRADLVTSGMGSSVMVWLGNGRGEFAPAAGSAFPVGDQPWGIGVADLNADGKLDLVTADTGSDAVSVLLGR